MTKHADSLQETQAKELLRNMLITTVGVESAQLDPLMDLFELVSYKKKPCRYRRRYYCRLLLLYF